MKKRRRNFPTNPPQSRFNRPSTSFLFSYVIMTHFVRSNTRHETSATTASVSSFFNDKESRAATIDTQPWCPSPFRDSPNRISIEKQTHEKLCCEVDANEICCCCRICYLAVLSLKPAHRSKAIKKVVYFVSLTTAKNVRRPQFGSKTSDRIEKHFVILFFFLKNQLHFQCTRLWLKRERSDW